MNVLIACEESQEVCKAFRALGHRAFSCDLQECSGGHPEWHIQGDVLPLLNGNCTFTTADTHTHTHKPVRGICLSHILHAHICQTWQQELLAYGVQKLKKLSSVGKNVQKVQFSSCTLHLQIAQGFALRIQ